MTRTDKQCVCNTHINHIEWRHDSNVIFFAHLKEDARRVSTMYTYIAMAHLQQSIGTTKYYIYKLLFLVPVNSTYITTRESKHCTSQKTTWLYCVRGTWILEVLHTGSIQHD